jgi:hypothetical protein
MFQLFHVLRIKAFFVITLASLLVFSGCTPRLDRAQTLVNGLGPALEDTDTASFTVSLTLDGVSGNFQNTHLTLQGQLDTRNLDNMSGSVHIIADGVYNQENFSIDANMLAVNQRLYLQLNSLSNKGLAAALDVRKLLNQFVQISDARIFSGNLDALSGMQRNTFSNIDVISWQRQLGDLAVLTATADNGVARINNKDTRLVSVKIAPDEVRRFLTRHNKSVPELLITLLSPLAGDVWVSESDNLPYQFHFSLPLTSEDGSIASLAIDGNAEYNQEVTLAAPKGAVPLPIFLKKVLPVNISNFLLSK